MSKQAVKCEKNSTFECYSREYEMVFHKKVVITT